MRSSNRRMQVLILLLGLACGVGLDEGVRFARRQSAEDGTPPPARIAEQPPPQQPAEMPPAAVLRPPETPPAAAVKPSLHDEVLAFDHRRALLSGQLLQELESGKPTPEQRRQYVYDLGIIATPDAIDWLMNHNRYIYTAPPNPKARGGFDFPDFPSMSALHRIGIAAVPQMVEAYITWPADRWPDGFMLAFYNNPKGARAAYIYAQGYLFATKENGHHRDAVLKLIRELRGQLSRGDLPYPPPWMTATEN